MTDEPEICEFDECENQSKVVVTEENSSGEMYVCHQCMMDAMSLENFE